MKKVTVSLENNVEVVEMILDIFKGKDGAKNLVSILKAKIDKTESLHDKGFDKALRELKQEWFN